MYISVATELFTIYIYTSIRWPEQKKKQHIDLNFKFPGLLLTSSSVSAGAFSFPLLAEGDPSAAAGG